MAFSSSDIEADTDITVRRQSCIAFIPVAGITLVKPTRITIALTA